jgi:hypothetical protein
MLLLGFAEMRVSPYKLCGILLALGMLDMPSMKTFNVLFCMCNSTVAALGTLKGPLGEAQVSVMRRVNSVQTRFTGKDRMHENIMGPNNFTEEQMQFLCDTTIPGARKFPLHDSAPERIISYFRDTSAADQKKLKKMLQKMSRRVHPDKNPHNKVLAQQAFICLQSSYKTYADELARTWQHSAQHHLNASLSLPEMFGIASICVSFLFVCVDKLKKWVQQA